jgi:acetyl-CoA carboxylase carboxyl transferase subunit beta
MLDRVTPRTKLRDELIQIIRLLMGLPPAVRGDLPAPAAPAPEPEAAPASAAPAAPKADKKP